MEKKTTKVNRVRLSPNEEAQFVREELERMRKMRVQQVREQERYIAQQVRREVLERQKVEIHNLSATLRDDWENKHGERLHSLEKLYEDVLRAVGQSYRSAKQTEPDWYALAQTSKENKERATKRHQQALRDLASQRQEDIQRSRQIEARKKALIVEKKRAAKVASLPQPFPNPIESIGIQTPLPNMANVQHFFITYCHVPETPVDNDADIVQSDTQQAAMLEAQRLEELESQEVCDRQEQLEMARLRGVHALQEEKVIQDSARFLCELERLQQADLQERKQVVYSVPAQIFQPPYRCDEQQRELEIAFQDLYSAGKDDRDDFVLVPEPLPAPSDGSDEDLNVTLKSTPCEKTEAGEESAAPPSQPVVSSGQTAVKRLLKCIRSQREQWSWQEFPPGQGRAMLEKTSIETGPLTNQEWKHAPSIEEDKSYESQAEMGPKVSEESILDGSMLLLEEQFTETKRSLWEWEQFRQQEEQLDFLYQLEEKRCSLELQLLEAQLYSEMAQNAVQERSMALVPLPGSSSLLESRPRERVSGASDLSGACSPCALEFLQSCGPSASAKHLNPVPPQTPEVRVPLVGMASARVRFSEQTFAEKTSRLSDLQANQLALLKTTSPSQSHACTPHPLLESNEFCVCESASGVRMKPPVSRPPRTVQMLLQELEQHELSTIQEVDTPPSATQNTAIEDFSPNEDRPFMQYESRRADIPNLHVMVSRQKLVGIRNAAVKKEPLDKRTLEDY